MLTGILIGAAGFLGLLVLNVLVVILWSLRRFRKAMWEAHIPCTS